MNKSIRIIAIIFSTLIVLGALWYFYANKAQAQDIKQNFILTSPSFTDGQPIPSKHAYTDCRGDNSSPELAWSGAPAETQSFALIVDDPDAPGKPWLHWLMLFPATVSSLPELAEGQKFQFPHAQLANDFGNKKYDGPCPPSGTHHYYFTLYALNSDIIASATTKRTDFFNFVRQHTIGKAVLMGTYKAQ
jgi:Raf kinase inhibitor-like YbhB/YbcL family protein